MPNLTTNKRPPQPSPIEQIGNAIKARLTAIGDQMAQLADAQLHMTILDVERTRLTAALTALDLEPDAEEIPDEVPDAGNYTHGDD